MIDHDVVADGQTVEEEVGAEVAVRDRVGERKPVLPHERFFLNEFEEIRQIVLLQIVEDWTLRIMEHADVEGVHVSVGDGNQDFRGGRQVVGDPAQHQLGASNPGQHFGGIPVIEAVGGIGKHDFEALFACGDPAVSGRVRGIRHIRLDKLVETHSLLVLDGGFGTVFPFQVQQPWPVLALFRAFVRIVVFGQQSAQLILNQDFMVVGCFVSF